ncbi:hypothetical protein [Prolixibacter sp. NT017]|uniref:hypothetical protein n=1 Tax=Prolixibacter sp. NT017 TaxID=2652390 RepID=UPI0012707309|nr:hypothetical protein [Prolixibacter sp. NT017]GET26109.1 hypothetical protein NT017_24380 [Prolixibacter sp. NT017]
MGRKEYFESLEDLRLLRESLLTKENDDPLFRKQSKDDMMREIDKRLHELKEIVERD